MLGDRFAGSRNSLNAIRLLLAASVIVSHSWWLGGYGAEPQLGGVKLGSWAVMGFFGISGYLITRSRMTAWNAWNYSRARLLRIFPGLVVCVAVTAFLIAPLAAGLNGRNYVLSDAVVYFVTNLSAGAPRVAVGGIPGSLDGLPDPRLWNGPLWTLFWELICYAVIGLVAGILRPQLARIALLVPFLVGSTFVLILDAGWGPVSATPPDWPLVPVLTFLAGSLVYLFRDLIPAGPVVVGICILLVVVIAGLGFAPSLVHLPLSIFLVAGSLQLPLSSWGSKFDISYGVYIYGWPVQQFLASMGVHNHVPPIAFAGASLMLVVPLAWLSCIYVEGPARLLHRTEERRQRISELA